jgi:glycine/D-amino acid oxidase-like deaminating enzyme
MPKNAAHLLCLSHFSLMVRVPRRRFLEAAAKAGVAAGAWAALGTPKIMAENKQSAIVVGAGAFGGWTALHLVRAGLKVTLFDTWGPGNSRASSGGETRVIRSIYGPSKFFLRMNQRALQLWKQFEHDFGYRYLHRTGVLWMTNKNDEYERAAMANMREANVGFEQLSPAECAKRWPQINFEAVEYAIFEPDAGFLLARRSCETVLMAFRAAGGEYRQLEAKAGAIGAGKMDGIQLANGTKATADHYVFACGPWMGKLFPEVLSKHILPTRQEVYFFGVPAHDHRFDEEQTPAWIDNSERLYYGIPGNQWRGFKLADDTRGAEFDPTNGERMVTTAGINKAREYMSFRFPGMKNAPLVETRVCQYENSSDQAFILDRHPSASNLWLLGGGSGHGFKHGPAFGEMAANAILGKAMPEQAFRMDRFK